MNGKRLSCWGMGAVVIALLLCGQARAGFSCIMKDRTNGVYKRSGVCANCGGGDYCTYCNNDQTHEIHAEQNCAEDCKGKNYSCVKSGDHHTCQFSEIDAKASPHYDFCEGTRKWCIENLDDPDNKVDCQTYAKDSVADNVDVQNWTSYPGGAGSLTEFYLGQQWAKYRWHLKYPSEQIDITQSCLITGTSVDSEFNHDFCRGVQDWCNYTFNDPGTKAALSTTCRAKARAWIQTDPRDSSKTLNGLKIIAAGNYERGRAWASFSWDKYMNRTLNYNLWPEGAGRTV